MYTFKLREWAGVNAQTGQPQWYKNKEIKDANGNVTGIDRSLTSKASEAEKVKVGTGIPDFMGGLTNRFEYKGFDLSFLFIFKKGVNCMIQNHSTIPTEEPSESITYAKTLTASIGKSPEIMPNMHA